MVYKLFKLNFGIS